MKYNLVEIDISSFRGFAIGAEHYYGKWKVTPKYFLTETGGARRSSNDPRHRLSSVEIRRPLTSKEAKYLNTKDETSIGFRWKRGDLTDRFDTKDDIIETAKKQFKELFNPDEDILYIKKQVGYYDMMVALDGPVYLIEKINAETDWYKQNDLIPTKYRYFEGDD